MTNDGTDMSTPVTRGELRDELAQLESRIERKFDDKLDRLERKIDDKLDRLERKFDDKLDRALDAWGGALRAQIVESEKRVINELARHTRAAAESMTTEISAIDEKYSDLPRRVAELELDVQALKQR